MNTSSQPSLPALKIDFVSDVVCPWCAIGLASLEQALAAVGEEVQASLHFQPFELDPQQPAEGRSRFEILHQKYGLSREQQAVNIANIRQRALDLGFDFKEGGPSMGWNTFAAHRLLHWAGLQGAEPQLALKKALLGAYFTHDRNVSDVEVLVAAAIEAGLDAAEARQVIDSGAYAQETREREQFYIRAGISGVPAIIFNDQHLISGGQPPEVFERAIRQIAGLRAVA
jgi:predicted DsbA family dithiol-disulfide isomerase